MSQRRVALLVAVQLIAVSLGACGTASSQLPPTEQPVITPAPLNKTAYFWDLGVSITYPGNWADPLFIAGQMTLGPTVEAVQGQTTRQPVIALRILDTARELNLSKGATLPQIAAALTGGNGVTLSKPQGTYIAGLDAASLDLDDTNRRLYGNALAFRLPDGRVSSFIAFAPYDVWANFAPTFDAMRASAKLLKPADFAVPTMSSNTGKFPLGGITFTLPQGWVESDFQSARLVHAAAATEYLDSSGFANGAQLAIVAQFFDSSANLRDAMTKNRTLPGDTVSDITVGGQPAVQIQSNDSQTGQAITFIGFTSADKTRLILFRWTTPGMLKELMRPTLDAILASVKFGPVAPVGTAPASAATQAP